ncbi:MAG: substrate-binding domain-containing protein, partial [Devosia nanyangense]|nr:substrate-binding domain-containing protein [Devosia nanyangense]
RADHRTGGRLMAEHVIALGHKRVGLVSGGQDLLSSRERHEGFMDAARGKLDICWDVEVSLIPTLPQTAIDAIRRRDVTMIACVNDVVAIGVLSVLRDSGIAVPAEVSVFGFDDMVWSDWPLIDLTTIRQPLAELGRDAVELLVDRLNDPTRPQTDIVLPVSLTERGSTRAL